MKTVDFRGTMLPGDCLYEERLSTRHCDVKVLTFRDFLSEDIAIVSEPAQPSETMIIPMLRRAVEVSSPPQNAQTRNVTPLAIDELLLRMKAGDRDAAAEFLMRYHSRIRRRIRGKLGPHIRRLFDSLDILSTIGRRLDLYVMSGRLQAASEAQLWNLLFKLADNAMVDKARIFKQLQDAEGEDSEFAQQFAHRLHDAEHDGTTGAELEIENCLRLLDDPVDRKILSLWLLGETHAVIAEHVDLGAAAVRKRWERIKSQLKERFEIGAA